MLSKTYATVALSPFARFDWVLLNPQPLPPRYLQLRAVR